VTAECAGWSRLPAISTYIPAYAFSPTTTPAPTRRNPRRRRTPDAAARLSRSAPNVAPAYFARRGWPRWTEHNSARRSSSDRRLKNDLQLRRVGVSIVRHAKSFRRVLETAQRIIGIGGPASIQKIDECDAFIAIPDAYFAPQWNDDLGRIAGHLDAHAIGALSALLSQSLFTGLMTSHCLKNMPGAEGL
jgi:hypothetical protein